MAAKNAATASRPRNQVECGGIAITPSAVSNRDVGVDVGARPCVDVSVHDIAQGVALERELSTACWLRSGSRWSTVLWARCRALSIPAGELSSVSATSRAEKPSTARWRAGRCWSAAMKASSTLSRCS
jgi:hypothetical protein